VLRHSCLSSRCEKKNHEVWRVNALRSIHLEMGRAGRVGLVAKVEDGGRGVKIQAEDVG
jgi:hypothetical protein